MCPNLVLQPSSALNLELQGSVGTFRIGRSTAEDDHSVQVRYISTHIGFDPSVAANEAMLRHLQPVREIFDFQSLGFDEIMQRDIDDMRVSTELIPYILDESTRGRIKFFPPIVVVVLPIDKQVTRPGRYYPKVTEVEVPNDPRRGTAQLIRAGEVGQEAFQFEYPTSNGAPLHHDLARLKLNTNATRLVILDGQHRAMALLAIYRNLRDDWTDARRLPFKGYYQEWTKAKIQAFDLKSLQLPMIVCTFPELDETYKGDLDIIRAARTTFLTLNKTARKVSNARNILLDDRDLISHFLREVLGEIKQKDLESKHSLRIWNVELDQYRDRTQITSPMAITGVPHVYYAIEHVLLDENDVNGLQARSGRFQRRSYVEPSLLRRLDGENLLGAVGASALKRYDYSQAAAKTLTESFARKYGQYFVKTLESFPPFEVHCRAALETEIELTGNVNPQVRTILFEGQSIGRTFEEYLAHMENVARSASDAGTTLAPEIVLSLQQLRGTRAAVDDVREIFRERRARGYLERIQDKGQMSDEGGKVLNLVRATIDKLYDERYSTVAFQAALTCGFFLIIEKAEAVALKSGSELSHSHNEAFEAYIQSIGAFFAPTTIPRFRNLIRVFSSEINGDTPREWKPRPSPQVFGEVVSRTEMKPDEWPKYRYLILELWVSADPVIAEVIRGERDLCRRQAFSGLFGKKTKDFCVANQKGEEDLTEAERTNLFMDALANFNGFLKNLGLSASAHLSQADAKAALTKNAASAQESESMP